MTTPTSTAQAFSAAGQRAISSRRTWTGRIVSGFAALFLLVDGVMKLFKPASVLEATIRLGFPLTALVGIGLVLIACTLLYLIPRTSILGAVLLTGYLGGAVATQVRAGSSWFETVFPVLIGVLVWGGLWLRDERLQNLLPIAR
jgi:DoxX-like family